MARRDALAVCLFVCALPTLPAHAGNGWFSHDCTQSDEAFPTQPQRTLLRVLSNPRDAGEDAVVLRTPDGGLYAQRDFFEHLRLPVPSKSLRDSGSNWYALDAAGDLRYYVDACAQTLSVDVSRLRAVDVRTLLPDRETAPPRSEPGAYLQADLQYLHDRYQDTVSGVFDAGLFGPYGQAHNSTLYDGSRAVRLDTSWTVDDPERLHRLSLGDGITRGGAFGRALRFGGVQWGTDFALQPDIVTFPLPGLDGTALLPSAVDVYVDGNLRAHQDVDAGPFQLNRIPVITGGGQMQLVVTDLLGRSTVYRYDFYAAQQLLRAGLDDYTFEAGSLRLDYGAESLHYDDAFGAATWRHGFSDRLTGEAHVEGSADRQFAAAGAALLVPWLGIASGGIATGSGDSHGAELSTALERTSTHWSYGFSYTHTPRMLLRIGETQPASLQRIVARCSLQTTQFGSISLVWLDDRDAEDQRQRGLNLGYNASLWRRASLYVGGFADADDPSRNSLYAGITIGFGNGLSASGSWQHDSSGDVARLAVQRSRLASIGWDGGAYAEFGDRPRTGGNVMLTTPQAFSRIDVEHSDADGAAVRADLRSGIVDLGHDWFWTRPIDGPFAVVETDSATPIRVYDENRLVGTTISGDALLVPELRAYETRQISVADTDYAIDTRLDERAQRIVAPGYGGVRVRFGNDDEMPTLRIKLQREDGSAPPAGSTVDISDAQPTFSGFTGEVLLNAPTGRHRLDVKWFGGACRADVDLYSGDRLSTPQRIVPCHTVSAP